MLRPVTVITAAEVVDLRVPTSIELDGSDATPSNGQAIVDTTVASHPFPGGSVWAEGTS